MKTRLALTLIMIIGFLFISSKSETDLINDEFPEEKQEVMETFGAISHFKRKRVYYERCL